MLLTDMPNLSCLRHRLLKEPYSRNAQRLVPGSKRSDSQFIKMVKVPLDYNPSSDIMAWYIARCFTVKKQNQYCRQNFPLHAAG